MKCSHCKHYDGGENRCKLHNLWTNSLEIGCDDYEPIEGGGR